jgi:hypothetical protein
MIKRIKREHKEICFLIVVYIEMTLSPAKILYGLKSRIKEERRKEREEKYDAQVGLKITFLI